MARKPRIHYTETDKALMWDRCQEWHVTGGKEGVTCIRGLPITLINCFCKNQM